MLAEEGRGPGPVDITVPGEKNPPRMDSRRIDSRGIDFRGQVMLAPLTKGGNLPFRRLCLAFGARVTMSEMAYARQVVRRRPTELALLRKHPDEPCFGVQIAAGKPADAVAAGREAVERGAAFVDLNAGCPIHDTVRRGMGATLLQRPAAMARIVEAMVEQLPVPVTVKIRSGWAEGKENAGEVARLMEEAGASAVILHARTREQRYTRAADWSVIARLAAERGIPVIGNGDLLTWYEVEDRWKESGCASVMLARGVLIKPWLFHEVAERRELDPDAEERVGFYFRFAAFLKEHFREDQKGRKRAMHFLPWHLGFFCRYRPLLETRWRPASREHPLLQTRLPAGEDLPLLERLLRDPRPEVHRLLADALWEAADVPDALRRFREVAERHPPQVEDAGEIATSHG